MSFVIQVLTVLSAAAALFSPVCRADDPPPPIWDPAPVPQELAPLPSHSPQVEALREAKFRLGEGQRLYDEGDTVAGREKWIQAAALFQQAEDGLGEADAYLRLADSLQAEAMFDAQARRAAVDYYIAALLAASGVYESLIQKEIAYDQSLLERADALYRQGFDHAEREQCEQAISLLDQARGLYREADYGAGEIRALMIKARCLIQSDEMDAYLSALALALEGLNIAQDLPLGTPTSERYLEGLELYRQGRFEEALQALDEARQGYQAAGDAASEAQTLNDAANVYATWGDYTRADDLYRQALHTFIAVGDRENEGAAWNNLGNLALLTGEFAAAQEHYAQAIEIWRELGLPEREAASLNGLGLAWREVGDYGRALDSFEQALEIARQLHEAPEEQGDALNNIGTVHYAQGHLALALDYFEQALELYREPPNPLKEAAGMNNLGSVYAELGEYQTALDYFARSRAVGEQLRVQPVVVKSLLNAAAVHLQQGASQEAIAGLTRSLDYLEQAGEKPTLAMVHSNLGAAYLKLGDIDQAAYHLEQARQLFESLGHFEGLAYAAANLGWMALQQGDWQAAEAYLRQSLTAWETAGNPVGRARALGNLGAVVAAQGDYEQALVYQLEALALSEQAGTQADQARLLVMVGASTLGLDEMALAGSYAQEALALAQTLGDPSAEIAARVLLGMVEDAAGHPESAYTHALAAIRTLEDLHAAITVGALKSSFMSTMADAYALAVQLAFETGQPEAAFWHAEQTRARALLDQLANRRLGRSGTGPVEQENDLRLEITALDEQLRQARSAPALERHQEQVERLDQRLSAARQAYTHVLQDLRVQDPAYEALVTGRVPAGVLAEVQARLDQNTTLLEYFVAEDRTLVFVVAHESFQVIALGIGRQELRERTAQLRGLLASKAAWDLPPKQKALEWFYGTLLAPALPYVTGNTLGIVPHDALHYVPFAALSDGQHSLIERFTLFYLPAASVLPFLPPRPAVMEHPALVLAHPGVGGLPRLVYASAEARTIAALYDTPPRIEQEATEGAVKTEAGAYAVLHIAAHGELIAASPLFSALRLAPGELEDGRLEVQEIYEMDLSHTSLVVLSACQTQIDPAARGEEWVSLQRAFLHAGTPSVVASLWSVDDEATRELMTRFHRRLRAGQTKAEALRLAQLEVRERYPDPYFWAAFTLAGDPGALFSPAGTFQAGWIVFGLFFLGSGWLMRIKARDQAG